MSKPTDTLWEYEEHTQAKHRLLVGYLHAWYPIMASNSETLNLIDGFAGPGRYTGGEPGSPILKNEPDPSVDRAEIGRFGTAYRIPDETSHVSQPRSPSTSKRHMRRMRQDP